MEDERFDALIRALGGAASRRGILLSLVSLVGLGLGETAAKRPHHARGHVHASRGGKEKMTLCHRDEDGAIHRIEVATSAVKAHLKHGDFAYDGCCVAGDCPDAGAVCHEGACCTPNKCTESCTCGVIDQGCGLGQTDCAQECVGVRGTDGHPLPFCVRGDPDLSFDDSSGKLCCDDPNPQPSGPWECFEFNRRCPAGA